MTSSVMSGFNEVWAYESEVERKRMKGNEEKAYEGVSTLNC